jgi:adenylosuccinate lyase
MEQKLYLSLDGPDRFDIDRLNREITSAIWNADQLGNQLVNAWLAVAEAEKKLAISLPFGPERRIAERGINNAKKMADQIKALVSRE